MAKRNNFTEEDINNIIKLHNDGLLNREIAEQYNTSKSSIARILQNTDLPSRHPWMSEERENKIIELYNLYHRMNKIEEILHVGSSTVKDILQKHNVYIYTNSELHTKYSIDENYFDNIDTNNKAYIMGLLFSDGTVNRKSNAVALSLQEEDRHILESIQKELMTDKPLGFIDYKSKNPNHKNQYCLTLNNKHIHDTLIAHGVIPNKSLLLEFPTCIEPQFYSKFILGIMDGDGTISKNPKDKRCSFLSTEPFCLSAKEIIEHELNIHCSIMLGTNKNSVTRVLQIAGNNQVKKFLDWLYDDAELYLYRKHAIYERLYL